MALWNGQDATLKERLFGLTNNESKHGEDVKGSYSYLDSTPTHSYVKYLATAMADLNAALRLRPANQFAQDPLRLAKRGQR